MNLFENILLDTILILFPFLIVILYNAYVKVYELKKTDLFNDFAIITSFYLVLSFSLNKYDYPYLMIEIPLLVAYLKNRKLSIILLSILCQMFLFLKFNTPIVLLIIEYLLYFGIYELMKNKKRLDIVFTTEFIILKVIFYMLYEIICDTFIIQDILIVSITFIIVAYLIYALDKKTVEAFSFENNKKELEKEKELRMTIFKITHEIKNPIAVCKGYLDMFDIDNKEKSKKYVNILKTEIDRVLALLEDFLSINKIKIEKDIIDLNMLLEEISNNFTPILRTKGIKKDFKISKDELFITADYNRLNQVLINIIKNSIESIEKDGLIKLYTKLNKTNIKIFIEDNGIGMTEEELNKVMQPFFSTKQKGTGLGVYLSKQIVQAHKGEIIYKSEKGKGTIVIIKLPYKELIKK